MLLSINPEHVDNILRGNKQVEFRKVRCKPDVEQIIIYSTAPVMRVVAEATVVEVIIGDILEVWRLTKAYSGITYNYYRKYYKGKKTAVAYRLGEIRPYTKPKTLADFGISHPPQSFLYITTTT
jgi:predicted transcriptional regulator